jgi:rare lipoprotein A
VKRPSPLKLVLVASCATMLASCAPAPVQDGPPARAGQVGQLPPDAVPRPEPRSRYGNGPVYEVLGTRYRVMESSSGYRERGVASWYGKKFHGNLTSNREPYDMYAMTAAHKSLPLPTYVRVTNLRNDRSVIVRVNDRGPFVHNRIIDLSYSAALKLDMIRDGTALVEVEAIGFDAPSGDRPARVSTPPVPESAGNAKAAEHEVYIQVGAFGARENAERRVALLRSGGIGNGFILEDRAVSPALFRVRVGPVRDGEQYDLLVAELEKLGIEDPYLVNQ